MNYFRMFLFLREINHTCLFTLLSTSQKRDNAKRKKNSNFTYLIKKARFVFTVRKKKYVFTIRKKKYATKVYYGYTLFLMCITNAETKLHSCMRKGRRRAEEF